MGKTRVLIVDDHPLIRGGLRTLLDSVPDIEIVGEAASGEEAIRRVDGVQPDVILMDIQMPGIGGIEAVRRILRSYPRIGIVMLTMVEDDALVFAAMRAGAIGYILKSADESQIVRAVQAAVNGEALFSPSIAKRLIHFMAVARAELPKPIFPELTDREREILGLIAQGLGNVEIAEQLVVSVKTVQNHATTIFEKLQVADRAQAALRAREAGLGQT